MDWLSGPDNTGSARFVLMTVMIVIMHLIISVITLSVTPGVLIMQLSARSVDVIDQDHGATLQRGALWPAIAWLCYSCHQHCPSISEH